MFRIPATALRAAVIALPALLAVSIAIPASAQVRVSVSFNNFHSRLAPYGTWSHNSRWGDVWHPTRVSRDFRPYYNGYWVDTREYGWLWVSDESWGNVAYHYGRWVHDPRDGWLWIPGYVWGPSWVVWRSGGGNIGWFPMPPDDNYYGDGVYRGDYDNEYGYRDWYGPSFGNDQFLSLWIFVGESHFRDRHFHNYAVPQRSYGGFISQTRDTTNYATVNNFVVNRSIDDARLQSATKQRFQPVAASTVIGGNALVTQAPIGRQVEQRERQQHPIPTITKPAGVTNLNSNVQPSSTTQAPQSTGSRLNGHAPASNGPVQTNLKTNQGAAVTGTPPPKGDATPQGRTERLKGGSAGPATTTNPPANSGGQLNTKIDHGAAVINTPPPKDNASPQGRAERLNRGPAGPATTTNPPANSGGQMNSQADHGAQSSGPPPTHGASGQSGNVQDTRPPPQIQGNAPAAGPAASGPGGTTNDQAHGNKQGDNKNTDNQKPADKRNKDGGDSGPN